MNVCISLCPCVLFIAPVTLTLTYKTWPRYAEDVPAYQKTKFLVKAFI